MEHFGWVTNISPAILSGHLDMRPKAASQSNCKKKHLNTSRKLRTNKKHSKTRVLKNEFCNLLYLCHGF